VTITFTKLLNFNGDFSFGKEDVGRQIWAGGADRPGCFAKKACTTAVEWAGALMQICCSAHLVVVNAMITQYTSPVNGVSLPTD